jgi:uncharacterized protein (DUF58 family)
VKNLLVSAILKPLSLFAVLSLAGMFFGNLLLLYMSLVPLLTAICGLTFDDPGNVEVVRRDRNVSAWVNEDVENSADIRVTSGVGIVTVGDKLPEHFQLVEGNNFRVFWKGMQPLSVQFRYRVKCTRRGVYSLGPLKYECRHFSTFRQTELGTCEKNVELVVKPKPSNIKRMRDPRTVSKIPMPQGSITKLGIRTTDFKEIREYLPGDSYRHINWKATARLPNTLHSRPLVNEYEHEGKTVVWIFLDGSNTMALGTSVENAFEHALQAVSGLAEFYIARNCHVGLCVYSGHSSVLLPDAGRKQEYRIRKETLNLEMFGQSEPLKIAIEKCRGHLLGTNPFFIIVTSVSSKNLQELIDGVKGLNKYVEGTGRRPQILLLNVMGNYLAARSTEENLGAFLLEMKTQPAIRALRRAGVFVTSWNPPRQSLTSLMIMGAKRRR